MQAGAAGAQATPTLQQFGWGRMGGAPSGSRPLLVVMAEAEDEVPFASGRGEDYWKKMVFGQPTSGKDGNVVALSAANSTEVDFGGKASTKFRWKAAGFAREHVADTGDAGCSGTDDLDYLARRSNLMRRAVVQADLRGAIEIGRFDSNKDGKVGTSELGVLVVINCLGSGNGHKGKTFGIGTIATDSGTFKGSASYVQPNVSMELVGHELSHLLGTRDLYPDTDGDRCMTDAECSSLTMMAFSSSGGAKQLDPAHKLALGWITPRIVDLRTVTEDQCIGCDIPTLAAAVKGDVTNAYDYREPVLFYDSKRGTSEFFLVEARDRRTQYDSLVNRPLSDATRDARGVVIWRVRLNKGSFAGGIGDLAVVRPASGQLWTSPADGVARLRWSDGSPVVKGLRVSETVHGKANWWMVSPV